MNENEILALEDKRFAAMTGKDWKALDALLHDQLLYTHSSGVTDTKAVWMDAMKAGRTVYKSVKHSDRKVRVYGDNALVTGKAAIEAEVNGQARSMRLVYLDVWTKTSQGW
jgi:ketosteroid isomerase-like protein